MFGRVLIAVILIASLTGCKKQTPIAPEVAPSPREVSDEPIQKLARDASQKIYVALKNGESTTIEILDIDSHDIFPAAASSYFEIALVAQLASNGIKRASGEWQLQGDLSKQEGQVVFSFRISRKGEQILSDSARIPDDERLRNTLAQFKTEEKTHDHSVHKEMPVPTPLAELKQVPLDVAENCTNENDCTLLLLYSNELVERNWKDASERSVPLPATGLRSRAPSGKILFVQDTIFVITNQLGAPLVLNRNLDRIKADFPARLPRPEPGLNTYALSDGRFFDFEAFGANGLAVIDLKNRLSVAEQGKLASADQPAGGTVWASLPFIYTSSSTLPGQNDSILKFIYKDGLIQFDKSQNIEGTVYDIAITDLNHDRQKEMLVTVRNSRGIFIEVYEPF